MEQRGGDRGTRSGVWYLAEDSGPERHTAEDLADHGWLPEATGQHAGSLGGRPAVAMAASPNARDGSVVVAIGRRAGPLDNPVL